MSIVSQIINTLTEQSEVGWYTHREFEKNNYIISEAMDMYQANELMGRLDKSIEAKIEESRSNPDSFRIYIQFDKIEEFSKKNTALIEAPEYELQFRTKAAHRVHGSGPILFAEQSWEQVGANINFAGNVTTKLVSLGGSHSREKLFLDLESPWQKSLRESIAAECQGKDVEAILNIVNKRIDELTTNHPSVSGKSRQEIENGLDDRLSDYLNDRKQGRIKGKPANLDVTIDELMEVGILVCRHKGLLAASIMGYLIDQKILPEGSARQYRSDIHDFNGNTVGAHTWSVYRDGNTGELWVNDPRWGHVVKVDHASEYDNIGYGKPALKQMKERLSRLDRQMLANFSKENKARLNEFGNGLDAIVPGVTSFNAGTSANPGEQLRIEFFDYSTNEESRKKFEDMVLILKELNVGYAISAHGEVPFIIIRADNVNKLNSISETCAQIENRLRELNNEIKQDVKFEAKPAKGEEEPAAVLGVPILEAEPKAAVIPEAAPEAAVPEVVPAPKVAVSAEVQKPAITPAEVAAEQQELLNPAKPFTPQLEKAKQENVSVVADTTNRIESIKAMLNSEQTREVLGIQRMTNISEGEQNGLKLEMKEPPSNVYVKDNVNATGVNYSMNKKSRNSDETLRQVCKIAIATAIPGTEFDLSKTSPDLREKVNLFLRQEIEIAYRGKPEEDKPKIKGISSPSITESKIEDSQTKHPNRAHSK